MNKPHRFGGSVITTITRVTVLVIGITVIVIILI